MTDLRDHIEDIARALLGNPNPVHSSRSQWRYGSNGSIAIEITGVQAGAWYDHELEEGGGPWELLLRELDERDIPDWLAENCQIYLERGPGGHITDVYAYRSEDGRLLFEVCRLTPKSFRQRQPTGVWNIKGVRRVLYRLPELLAADKDAFVYIPEGEKDADRLATLWGLVTTCNPMGAGKWRGEYAQHLRGRHCVVIADNDEAGRQHAIQVATSLAPVAASVRVLDLQGLPEKGDISDWIAAGGTQSDLLDLVEDTPLFQTGALDAEARTASGAAADGAQGDPCVGAVSGHSHGKARLRREGNPWSSERGKAILERVADIQTKPIDWHWPGWLARGKLHLLAGTKTTGKSTIALHLMATTTRTAEWPDGTEAPMGDTLIWSAEDDAEDTIKPRFLAAGGDPGRFHIIRKMRLPNGSMIPFDPSIHLAELKEAARALPELKMVVIDPVVMVIPGDADSHKNTETRRGLQPLVDFAEDLRVALIGITHFSKGTKDLDPIERVSGSLAFTAIPRVILGAWMDPETDERHLVRIASNIGPTGNGFSYELYEAPLAEHDFGALHLRWIEALQGSPEELLKPKPPTNGDNVDSALDEATVFLKDYLGLGPKPSEDVKKAAAAHLHSWRTVRRAQTELGIKPYLDRGTQEWTWALPEPAVRGFGGPD